MEARNHVAVRSIRGTGLCAFKSIALCEKEIITEQDIKPATHIDAIRISQSFFSNEIELVQLRLITIDLIIWAIKMGTWGITIEHITTAHPPS